MERRLLAGRYELHEPLGGSSWRATDTELGRDVLVRVGEAADVPGAALSHPSIERLFDQGEVDGERYAVLEHLPGGTLAERGELANEAAADVSAALAYAHSQGVAHGALSAAAIRFDAEGRAKVTGFTAGGDPADDVRALGALLAEHGSEAADAAAAAAAAAGEIDAAELADRLRASAPAAAAEEPTTLIQRPAAPPGRRGRAALALAALVLAAAGLVAALVAASDSGTERPAESLSVPVPTGGTSGGATEQPPPSTSEETTTEATTTEGTEPAPTETQPPTTGTEPPLLPSEPVPTVEPPPTTIELPPTTEVPPPTEIGG